MGGGRATTAIQGRVCLHKKRCEDSSRLSRGISHGWAGDRFHSCTTDVQRREWNLQERLTEIDGMGFSFSHAWEILNLLRMPKRPKMNRNHRDLNPLLLVKHGRKIPLL